MLKRILGVSLMAFALACASGGSGGGGDDGRGDFGKGSDDRGMDRRGGTGGAEASTSGFRTVYFDFDRAALREDAKRDLRHNAEVMRKNSRVRVEIQGNCDERGSEEYNLALGMRRADAAKRYLIDLGVDGDRIETISFGEENPAVRGSGESAWGKNRRDDFVKR